ncbi:hypothetical protein BDV10DRAFT_187918 [Aspergillus recurvatus]
MATPEIALYTNPNCPWAQRAHIALKELNLRYNQVIIDVEKPREERQVPTLSYNGTILTESGIIAQFLADAHPETETGSGLLLPSDTYQGAIQRVRAALLVDSWVSKLYPVLVGIILTGEDHATSTKGLVDVIEREIEPLLVSASAADGDANESKFFGGCETLTLAEVLVGPFLLWISTLVKTEYQVWSGDLTSVLQERAPRFAS